MESVEGIDVGRVYKETADLAVSLKDACGSMDGTIVLGALFLVTTAYLEYCPDKGYAIACADHMERIAREMKKRLKSCGH